MTCHIAPCGMNCDLCLAFQREKRKCPGCDAPDSEIPLKHCITCSIKRCEKREGSFCHDCESFPCTRLKNLDKRYQKRYGMSMIENLEMIRDEGIDAFLAYEEERWTCSVCGELLCAHRDVCLHCGAKNPRFPES